MHHKTHTISCETTENVVILHSEDRIVMTGNQHISTISGQCVARLLAMSFFLLQAAIHTLAATGHRITGRILDDKTLKPLPYATIKVRDMEQWAVADDDGRFDMANVPEGYITLDITTLGYVSRTFHITLTRDINLKNIRLKEDNLSLPGVEVTARRHDASGTTAYTMDRTTLDHSQVLSLSDISALLPGGQTINSSLINDDRLALRAGSGERGNAAFGTAIEIDGQRLDNNANMSETLSPSTRNIAASNIESVEVLSGIASVEYGDVAGGVVKVNTRRGHTPWIVEASVNPYTRQAALSKGLTLGAKAGIINLSLEHARSFSEIASPYTSYSRNNLSLTYSNHFRTGRSTLQLTATLAGNIGGYNSKADPDAFSDTYERQRDNQMRGNLQLEWLCSTRQSGVFNVSLQTAFSLSDKRTETYTNASSSSAQPYIHTTNDGYHIATDYSEDMGTGDIILGPTGYWYIRAYNDQKPLSLQGKLKGAWTRHLSHMLTNKVTIGTQWTASRNDGHGITYADMRYAPTWRPYDYATLPTMHNMALFLEDRLTLHHLLLIAGLRQDITAINRSAYGTVGSLSPRLTARYDIIKHEAFSLAVHAGYGKSVKLPSFQVLFPADTYTDRLTFTPGSTVDNKAYYAYYTHVQQALYNADLKWQHTHQVDLGLDLTAGPVHLSVSGYWSQTRNPYQMVALYTPLAYNVTTQSALEDIAIPSANRQYAVDQQTGIVTVTSANTGSSIALPYTTYHTYTSQRQYTNGSPVTRYGLEWIAEAPLVSNTHTVGLTLRFDGKYYHYKGVDHTLIAGCPNGVGDQPATAAVQPLIGYYAGSSVTSASSTCTPTVSNGSLTKGCNLNTTLTARIPRLRLIMTARLEATLLNYKRNLSEGRSAILLEAAGNVSGTVYQGEPDHYVALYPEYYSTWDNPTERIAFADALADARHNDPELYQRLCNLIVRSNTTYYFNPQRISAYYALNFSVTKEIGRWVSISFYANNCLNNMGTVTNSQTGLESSLFASGYIPKFYYGASLRLKL